ncbi:MAG: MerR family transcriptional regulator [Prochloraceae cyanobacterium]|nr:MerR family transcriptional regulator [Prochloraceae cyanobacterium]
MLKIGDFSRLSRVSIKALRLYDRLGLFKPAKVDPLNGYRYYLAEQITQLNRILDLKHLGFSLEQISELIRSEITPFQIEGMLRLKQTEIKQSIATEKLRLDRLETRLKQLQKEKDMSNYQVILKKVDPIRVISLRATLPNYEGVGMLFEQLMNYLSARGIKKYDYCAAIWHDGQYKERDVDGEAVISVDRQITSQENIKIYDLPGYETMACVVHKGSYQTLKLAYQAILNWLDRESYEIIAPNREVSIYGGKEQDNESYITEIQFPVQKI